MTNLKQQEEALFEAAQQLTDAGQRAAFLDAACDGNTQLRRRLDALLTVQSEADAFFDKPATVVPGGKFSSVADALGILPADGRAAESAKDTRPKTPSARGSVAEASGNMIGRYKLLQKLGEGGFGEVWMAEQKEPVKRRVALKIIKLGMDTKQVAARFEGERQALALMDHPNIAKVLDAGSTETGRPYFVMELVRGIRITDYCEQHGLSLGERLDLFMKVCQAIQHAHQKGIIHRDIKPANILVTLHDGMPVPKVIDFGIAKATQQELTDKTIFTQFHQFIGTPAYMSPEQAEMSGLDIDTRSDIYSLGVLLYELLTGQTPFDSKELMALGLDAMRKAIREKEPVRPSTRLSQTLGGADVRSLTPESKVQNPKSEFEKASSSASAKAAVDGRRLLQAKETIARLRGDLDWIVMKCLEKDRSRRYETANGLAMDIQRYLKNEPVLARSPSATYRLRKMIRRNRVAFAAAVMVAAALVLGAAASIWQAIRATRAEQEQARLRMRAEANELRAQEAQASESRERLAAEQARQNEAQLRRRAEAQVYASDMNLAQQALAVNNVGRAWVLLSRHRPVKTVASNQWSVISKSAQGAPLNTDDRSLITDLRGWEWRYLWQYCQNNAEYTLTQRPNSISSLSVSHDRKWLAVGEAAEGGLSIWDLETRREIRRVPTGEGEVAAAFSPREALLAFSSETRSNRQFSVCLWSEPAQQIITRLPLPDPCYLLMFSEDGRQLVTITRSGRAQLSVWRIPEGTKLLEFPLASFRASPGTPLAVTRNLSLAAQAVGGFEKDGGLRLIDLTTGAERWKVQVSDAYIATMAFSPDAKILAIAEGAGKSAIRLWDVETGREAGRLEGHHAYVLGLEFSPDGKSLASSSADQTIRLWDLDSRTSVATLRGHKLEVWRTALLPEARRLVSGCKDGSVMVWDVAVNRAEPVPLTLSAPVKAWSFAPDSRSILTLEPAGVTRWKGPTFQQREALMEIKQDQSALPARLLSKFSPDGELLAERYANGVIRVWDLQRKALVQQIQSPHGPVVPWLFLPQERKLLGAQLDKNSIHEWDLSTGQETRSWMVPSSSRGGAFCPDEHWCLALGFGEKSPLGELIGGGRANWAFNATPNGAVAISPDGKLLATLSQFDSLKLREAATLRELHTFGSVLMGIHSVAFSPDGRRLTAGSIGNEAIKIWDVESREEVLTLETLSEPVKFMSTAFSPDGNLLASMNRQGVLYLWRAPSWAEIEAAEAKEKAELQRK
jgi:serine/threonine protein kinase/WD40 repeat protein